MKPILLSLLAAVGLICIAASITAAQAPGPPGRGGPGGGFGGRMSGSALLQALDADGDGELSAKEIENASTALKTLDKDNDGKLAREELRPAIGGRGQGPATGTVQQLVAQIMTFDKNGDGKLSKDELPQQMQILIERVDANKDGLVDRTELTTFAEQTARRNPGTGGEGLGRPEGPGDGTPGPGPGGGGTRRRTRPQAPLGNAT